MGKLVSILALFILVLLMIFFWADLSRIPPLVPDAVRPNQVFSPIPDRILAIHSYQDNVHRYGVTFYLPHSCFLVEHSTRVKKGANDILNEVSISTEDKSREHNPCSFIPTRYAFVTVIESPQQTKAKFLVNDEEVPTDIDESRWQSPSGVMIEP